MSLGLPAHFEHEARIAYGRHIFERYQTPSAICYCKVGDEPRRADSHFAFFAKETGQTPR